MKDTAFTSGPYKIVQRGQNVVDVFSANDSVDGKLICGLSPFRMPDETAANAALIAAAPDQNAALIEADSFMAEVIEYLRDHHDVCDGDYGEPRPNRAMQLSTWADEVSAKIEAALLKASPPNGIAKERAE